MDLLTQRELALLSPVYRTQQSRPRWGSIQFEGLFTLRLYPYPAESLLQSSLTGSSGLFGGSLFGSTLFGGSTFNLDENIANLCIVSGFFSVDENSSMFQLPDYFVRRLVKLWVLAKAYACEGNGQNLDISIYYEKRYSKLLAETKVIMSRIYNAVERQYSDIAVQRPWKKAHPVLPPNFGTRVDY